MYYGLSEEMEVLNRSRKAIKLPNAHLWIAPRLIIIMVIIPMVIVIMITMIIVIIIFTIVM